MNLKNFIKKKDLLNLLLTKLKLINTEKKLIKLQINIDYDYIPYNDDISSYFFSDNWDFNEVFYKILDIDSFELYIINLSELEELKYNNSLKYIENNLDAINELYIRNQLYPFNYDDSPNIKKFNILSIDNTEKRIYYNGLITLESMHISIPEFEYYAIMNLSYINSNIKNDSLFLQILADCIILFNEKNYKLAFFLTYTAFESFLQEKSNNNSNIRLNDLINSVFKNRFLDLNKNKIYSSIMSFFDDISTQRNNIAHGKVYNNNFDYYENIIYLILLIISYELKIDTFDDLNYILRR